MASTPALIDRFNRKVEYVRLSVTDRCDFRCTYCMAEDMTFLPRQQILTLEELAAIGHAFVELGVNKIRLTGGEPLIRPNVVSLIQSLGVRQELCDLALTTNGSQLATMSQSLSDAGLSRVNISLDSLKPDRFKRITRTGNLDQVLAGIKAASKVFGRVKLNSVIMQGHNDDEILDLVQFAIDQGVDISFIEEMPLGAIDSHSRDKTYISSRHIQDIVETRFTLTGSNYQTGGPSRYQNISGTQSRLGFISPHSHNFCESCNRVRVTVEGRLLLCLGNEHSVDLKAVIRRHPGDSEILKQTIIDAMDLKPEKHEFDLDEEPQILRFMNMTGG